ncbi:helix-turn-helix transcriptional regulator [Tenacibaculum sp. TC6]|uniref:helix-turn-helix transcriptional regulator n=1 Tax=Tenacibaculum sp. TC6 TaxID=3423223 RepID=UPI003D35DED5
MKVLSLPKELDLDTSSIAVFNYHSAQEVAKQQINLTQNTFSFLIEGTKEIITHTSSLSINNSSFLLMKSGNCLMTEKLSDTHQNYQSLLLFFSNKTVLDFIRKYEIRDIKKSSYKSVHAFKKDVFIKNFIQGIFTILTLPSKTLTRLITLKYEELMLYLVETYGTDFLFSMIKYHDNQGQNFIQVVENNKFKKLTLKELAFLASMSVSSFKREFEKHFKVSPIKWFQEQRLEYASFLLRDHQKRPSEIYEEIGYENLSSFTQAFKNRFGTTPKQHQES